MKFACLFFILPLLFFSCKEDKPIGKTHCEIYPGDCEAVTEGKKFFAFKLGSWWLYEEENSGARDSVYVTQSYINPNSYDFDILTHSTLEGYNYHYWPMYTSGIAVCSTTDPINGKCFYVNRSKGKPGDFVGESYCFFINYRVNDYIYTGSDQVFCPENKIIVKEIHEDFTNITIAFDKTVKIHELCSFIEGKQPVNYFYSKNVGLIRKELLDSNQVWNLINYHIEP